MSMKSKTEIKLSCDGCDFVVSESCAAGKGSEVNARRKLMLVRWATVHKHPECGKTYHFCPGCVGGLLAWKSLKQSAIPPEEGETQ